jgi:hypothetical protein
LAQVLESNRLRSWVAKQWALRLKSQSAVVVSPPLVPSPTSADTIIASNASFASTSVASEATAGAAVAAPPPAVPAAAAAVIDNMKRENAALSRSVHDKQSKILLLEAAVKDLQQNIKVGRRLGHTLQWLVQRV